MAEGAKRGPKGPNSKQVPEENSGEQRAYFVHQLRLSKIADDNGACDMSNPQEVVDRRTLYLQACSTDGVKPTVPGFALALGTTPQTMSRYPSRAMVESLTMIENITVQMMEDSRIPMAPGIFLLKNWFGYRDEREVVTHSITSKELDAQEVEAKYVEAERVAAGGVHRLEQA